MRTVSDRKTRSALACIFSFATRAPGSKAPPRRTVTPQLRKLRPPVQGRRAGEWHEQHRSRNAGVTDAKCEVVPNAPLRRPPATEVDGGRARTFSFRGRLTGRTPRSERGDRGSTLAPDLTHPGRGCRLRRRARAKDAAPVESAPNHHSRFAHQPREPPEDAWPAHVTAERCRRGGSWGRTGGAPPCKGG
jgi:hypothetical protein